ncbi:hypothetical protein TNCV_1622491 [Trichonephila clavipes]|nr:hypothetical protein TNCV_1622491 [Trichonephila clavipes]
MNALNALMLHGHHTLQICMPSSGLEPRTYGTAVGVINHYPVWVADVSCRIIKYVLPYDSVLAGWAA